MDQRLSFLTVAGPVADAARFYLDGLGWTALLHVPGEVLMLQVAPGLVLAVHETASFAADTGDAGRPAGLSLAHNVGSEAEVDAVVADLEAAGAEVLHRPRRSAWGGWFAHVRDPLGVVWEVAHNPGWSVGPDGTVSL